jgi:hypothetical protein
MFELSASLFMTNHSLDYFQSQEASILRACNRVSLISNFKSNPSVRNCFANKLGSICELLFMEHVLAVSVNGLLAYAQDFTYFLT